MCAHRHGMGLINTCCDAFFVSLLAHEGFGQHKLRFIFCPRWRGRGMLYSFCVLDDIGGVWSTHVEIDFVSFLACEGIGQHNLRYVLCPRKLGRVLFNTF